MILPEHQNNAGLGFKFARALSNPVCLCLLLAAVTLVVYWPVTRYDFVNYDDPDYFSSNTHVQAGLTSDNVGWAFCTGYASNWHPLTWLSLMLDRELSGPGPAGPHFTNLLFHLANTVLLFLLLRQLTGLRRDPSASSTQAAANWRSAFVAALFALHPLHVESVAWISERKDVLSMFFGLLALWAYARYAQKRSRVESRESNATAESLALDPRPSTFDYSLALLFFVLGLMSKPMLVTLPFVMLLLDYWPLQRFKVQGSKFKVQSLVREKIPFFVLSAISCVVTFIAQQKGGAVVKLARISMTDRVANAFVSYARYLDKTLWPSPLANPYPHPGHWEFPLVIYSVALVAGLSAIAVLFARRFPFFFTGWFWFAGTLVPVIGLVQVGDAAMADRYTYLPLIGVLIVLVWGAGAVCANWRVPGPLIIFLAAIILTACAWRTRDQSGYWKNSGTLFRHTLAVTENNYVACNDLGTWLSGNGQVAEAMDYFRKSLQIKPDNPDALYNLGNAFAKLGNWDEAINNYQCALQVTPNQADILNNLGFALAAKKQFADAIACFEAALKLDPDCADAHNNLATVLFIQKRFNEAVRHFRAALRITPGNPQIYSNLGDALVKQGQTTEAVRCYREALRLKPGDPEIKAKLQALGAQISN
ncbi:MAG: tetratricopeptide repeat protein [Verrucomicrobiota bacterium]|jgi:Flp pilus assembly protein TadD